MQLSFEGQQLRRLIMEPNAAEWPSNEALNDVQALVADLIAASSLLEVPFGVPDLSQASVDGIELLAGDHIALKCRVDHVAPRTRADNSPAWNWINRIKIVGWREID